MDRLPGSRKRLIAQVAVVLMLAASHHGAAPSNRESTYRAARAALDRGETAQATALVDGALGKSQSCSDPTTCALLILRAELFFRTKKPDAAKAILERELPANARNSEAAVYRLILIGRSSKDAKAHFDAARAIAAKHHPRLLPIIAVSEIGTRGVVPGDQVDRVARKALAQAHGDPVAEVRVKAARGFRLVRQGRFAEAIDVLDKVAADAGKLQLVPTVANAQGNVGWAYFELGDPENAAKYFGRADRTLRERGLVGEGLAWTIQLGNIELAHRNRAAAAKRFEEVLEFTHEDRHAAHALQNLSRIALREGRIADARRLHGESFELKKSLGDEDDLAAAEIVEAEISMSSGQLERAKATLERVARGTKSSAIKWEARARLAQVYLKLQRHDQAEVQFRDAIATVRQAWTEIAADGNLEASELRLSFLTRAIEILDPYLDFLISQGRAEDALAAADAYRAQTMEEELGVARPRTFDAKAIARNANATILSYWLGEHRSYLWVITRDRVTWHKLPSDTKINDDADAYQRELRGRRGTLALSGARGQALYSMLIELAGPFARNARVVVVPDGRLHNINFETLVVPGPKPRYWIEDVIVTNAGSLQMLAGAPAKAPPTPKMLVVGDPLQADPGFGKLPNAAREVDAIARQFPAPVVLRGPNATPSSYFAAKPEAFDYLHFVAHGEASRQKPLDSAVILGRDKSSDQYRLTAREIVKRVKRLPLRARLVTISSCSGAGSRAYSGEGLVGLAWAFLSAGADQVIAALWQVDDAATANLMEQMYAGIRQGQDPASALRAAKLRMVRSGTIHDKPVYWAPFVLYDGR